jgi:hypothetical protein
MLERLTGCVLLAASFVLASCDMLSQPPDRIVRPAPPLPAPVVIAAPSAVPARPSVVHDAGLVRGLERTAQTLVDERRLVPLAELQKQSSRTQCSLSLPRPLPQKLTPSQIYEQCQRSVLIIGGIHKCDKCPRWHADTSSAFPITPTGAVVTNHHVVANKTHYSLVASTESLYYHVVDGRKEDLQMVFKHCVPAENVLKLIRR